MNKRQSSIPTLKKPPADLLFLIGATVVYILVEALNKIGIINSYLLQIIMYACINVMLTVGLNVLTGFAGQFSIGQAGFMAIGAYASAVLTKSLIVGSGMGIIPQTAIFLIAIIIGGTLSSLIAFLIGFPIFRLKGDYLAIVTLAFGEVIRAIIRISEPIGGARGLSSIPRLGNFFWVFLFLILVIFSAKRFVMSSYGRAGRAIRDNEIAAEAMGINPFKAKMAVFIYAAFISGVAGALYAHVLQTLQPEQFSYVKSVDLIIYMCAGGVGSLSGSILSAASLTLLPELLRFLEDYRLAVYGLLLVIIMIRKPSGFFGGIEYGALKWDNIIEVKKQNSFRRFLKHKPKAGGEE